MKADTKIRVDREVKAALAMQGTAGDTLNSVLRKLLNLDKPRKAPKNVQKTSA